VVVGLFAIVVQPNARAFFESEINIYILIRVSHRLPNHLLSHATASDVLAVVVVSEIKGLSGGIYFDTLTVDLVPGKKLFGSNNL
jgi:hypothetical protein